MFFKKYRDRKKAERHERDQNRANKLRDLFDTAVKCDDTGERLLLLNTLMNRLTMEKKALEFSPGGEGVSTAMAMGSLGTTLAGGITAGAIAANLTIAATAAMTAATGGLIVLPAVFVSGIGGLLGIGWGAGKVVEKMDKHFLDRQKEYHAALIELLPKTEALHSELLTRSPQEFAKSPMVEEVHARFPALKDQFMKEALRKAAAPEPTAGPPAPQHKKGLNL